MLDNLGAKLLIAIGAIILLIVAYYLIVFTTTSKQKVAPAGVIFLYSK